MDFRQIEAFVNVVKHRSFSKAADATYLTQPTISAHISTLENELGQRLLERGGKEIRPTESGRRFYVYARRMLALRGEALAAMRGGAENGSIDIAASSVPAQYLLPELVAEYHAQHPEISFNILRADSAGVLRRLREGAAEIGFCGSAESEESCEFLPVAEDRLALILPDKPVYRRMLAEPSPLAALLTQPMISREAGSGTRREFERYLQRSLPGVKPHVIAEMDDPEAIKRAVAAGLGVAVLSARAAEDYVRFGELLSWPLDETATRWLYLVRRKKDIPSPAARAFIDFVLHRRETIPQ